MALFDDSTRNFLSMIGNVADPSFMQEQPRMAGPTPAQTASSMTMQQPRPDSTYDQNILADAYRNAGVGRKRGSLVDVIGGVLDTLSEAGGGRPNYQDAQDSRLARARAYEEDMMARDKFGLDKGRFDLDKQKFGLDQRAANADILMKVGAGLRNIFGKLGADGVRQVLPGLVQSGMVTHEQAAWIDQNPEQASLLLEKIAKGGEGNKFYGTPIYVKNDKSEITGVMQLGEDGSTNRVAFQPGEAPALPMTKVEGGDQTFLVGRGGATERTFNQSGGPEKGEIPILDANNNVVGYRLQPGSTAQRKAADEADKTLNKNRGLQVAFDAVDRQIASARTELEILKNAGGMTGVPGQSVIGNIGAVAGQLVPAGERIVNSNAGSARKSLDSITTDLSSNLGSAVKEAQGAGIQLSARLMDTEKEVQRFKDAITNATDYNSAVKALDEFKMWTQGVRAELDAATARTQAKRDQVAPPSAPAAPSVSNW